MSDRFAVDVCEGEAGNVLSYVFTELPITIGRHEGNDVRLPRPFVSGFHARIERAEAGLSVLDLGSINGVRVRGTGSKSLRIASHEPQALSRCDNEFSIGVYRIRVRSGPDPQGSAASDQLSLPALTGCDAAVAATALPSLPSLRGAEPVPRGLPSAAAAGDRRACEAAALVALEELLCTLAPGLRLDTPRDVARLIQRLQVALELHCRGLVRLRRGQRRCASALGLPLPVSDAELAAEHVEQLTRQLCDGQLPVAELRAGLSAQFQALASHQVALLEGMIEGSRALLDELAPERIEARSERQRGSGWLPLAGKLRSLHRAYREHYTQLRRKDGALSLVFGRAFRDAYATYLSAARRHHAVDDSVPRSARRRG